MLDRSKVMRAIQEQTHALFYDHSPEYQYARQLWERICADVTFIYKVQESNTTLSVPTWTGLLGEVTECLPLTVPHQVIGVDGSQIYPDRHQGLACYLINIGAVILTYGAGNKAVQFHSEPQVFVGDTDYEGIPISPDVVNCRRDAYEFAAGVQLSKQCKERAFQLPRLLLLDGSLIFWHLEAKDQIFKQVFFQQYIKELHALYEQRMLCASYVSMPKHREVSHLLRLAACNFALENCTELENLEHINDAAVVRLYVKPYARTTVFKHMGSIKDSYPPHLQPHFFYVNTGNEIGRVEIPAWIARDAQLIDMVARILIDQCNKGNGYPVVLAEAHEQAVIKGPDRDFFYHLIAKVGIDNKQRVLRSQKSMKKRGIGI
jgi:NurA domain